MLRLAVSPQPAVTAARTSALIVARCLVMPPPSSVAGPCLPSNRQRGCGSARAVSRRSRLPRARAGAAASPAAYRLR
jgi:hypothetical protein